ncbi:MAG: 16S rRNA (cytosine(1402)-N(4))-methyltransferase RsmH [Bacteroidales bacterium]|nr:16S rRNA (cytosine(1402)-N(4))-methyltransferase RsmH [Bacteroidales bacterium]
MNTDLSFYHTPVLLHPSVDALNINPDGVYVDVTFGGGGHSREILSRLGAHGRLIAFDQDPDAYARRPDDERLTFVRHNFRYLQHFLTYLGIEKVDGILADLGVSSHHFDDAERGFSFRADGPLDMRMNPAMAKSAADYVAEASAEEIANILSLYGEVRFARQIANNIVKNRAQQPITTTTQLRDIVTACTARDVQAKVLAQVFQALRIQVNGEMDALSEMLSATPHVLREGGRLVVIAYHSLEDRMAKNLIRSGNVALSDAPTDAIYGHAHVPFDSVTRKPIVPDADEIEANPRARSAKLRVAERNGEDWQ